jgi:hypothetical protein
LLRFEYQTSLDRVAMHIAKFLHSLALGPHHEVVKATLPDMGLLRVSLPQTRLCRTVFLTLGPQKLSRKTLLEDLQNYRRVGALGFSDEQVDVFGHDDVSNHHEVVTAANLFEGLEEQISSGLCVEERTSLVTAESDEMQISGAVVSSETVGHSVMVGAGRSMGCDH